MSQANACNECMHCMHWPMMSQADACSYCMGSVLLISSRIYLFSSFFEDHRQLLPEAKEQTLSDFLVRFGVYLWNLLEIQKCAVGSSLVGDCLVRNLTGGKSEVGKFSWEKGVAKRVCRRGKWRSQWMGSKAKYTCHLGMLKVNNLRHSYLNVMKLGNYCPKGKCLNNDH